MGGAGRAGRTRRRRSRAPAVAGPARAWSPSCGSGPTRGIHRSCRASRWRRCTPRRAWSGTRCSWSGWPTARCRSRTRWRTVPTASRSKRSAACSMSESPGPECIWRSAGRWRRAPGGRQSRRPSRFLNGIAPQIAQRRHPEPASTSARRRAALPRLQQHADHASRDHVAPLRNLPVRHRRRTARPAQGLAVAHLEGDERACLRGVHRQHVDRDRRDTARPTTPRWSRSPASARASSSSSAPTYSRWSRAANRRKDHAKTLVRKSACRVRAGMLSLKINEALRPSKGGCPDHGEQLTRLPA